MMRLQPPQLEIAMPPGERPRSDEPDVRIVDAPDLRCPSPLPNPGPRVPDIHWEVVRERTALARLRREWSELADATPTSLFVTPEWVDAWLATIGLDVEPRIITGRDGAQGRLVVIWPLGTRTVRGGFARLRVLEPMGETLASGDRLDPLTVLIGLEDGLIEQVRALARSECDLVHWSELSRSGALAYALAGDTSSDSHEMQVRTLPAADLPGSYEEFAAGLSKKLRGHVRRQEQTALHQGLRWRLNEEGTSLEAAVDVFARLHAQCWEHRGQHGNLGESRFRGFVERFAEAAARRGWLRLHRLCEGDRCVAALMGFHHNGRACYYQSGWDPQIAKLSPGSLCIARAVRTAIEEGMGVFDFLRGDEPYKQRWANRHDETVTLAEAATLKGRIVLAGHDLKEGIKRGVRAVGGEAAWERLKRCVPGHGPNALCGGEC